MITAAGHRSVVEPVPAGVPRPLWSVMIPTHNCAAYLRDTLASVLRQDPGPEQMQIEVIDDDSTADDPEAVVAEVGAGRVGFFRQDRNVGHVRNFDTCVQRARGRLVHLLHGDDLVCDGFYRALEQGFTAGPEIGAAFCRTNYIDDAGSHLDESALERPAAGVLESWLEKIASGQRIGTPSIAVRREVYEEIGGFDQRFGTTGEDWEMWVRIATRHAVWFEPEPLALYRKRRQGSLTQSSEKTAAFVRDMRRACDIIGSYLPLFLPARRARACLHKARELYARWALSHAEVLIQYFGLAAATDQLAEALRLSRAPWVVFRVLQLMSRGTVLHLGKSLRPGAGG